MRKTNWIRRTLFEARKFPCSSKRQNKSIILLLYSLFPEEGRDMWVEDALLEFRGRKDALFNFLHKLNFFEPYPPQCAKGKVQFLYLLSRITRKRDTAKKLLNFFFS